MINCVYCNEDATELEHVIPASYFGFRSQDKEKQWIVPSCQPCNRLAGSSVFFSIPEKAAHILKKYKIKYKKILGLPYWSEKELKELSYILRSSVKGAIFAKAI